MIKILTLIILFVEINFAQSVEDNPPDSLNTTTVKHQKSSHKSKEISKQKLKREEFRLVAANLGDPFRSLITLPGVNQSSDASIRPWIRGGHERETRIFWNDIPLIQPYHMTSFFSIFPIETIEEMELYSSGFPSRGQGSLSGAIYMKSRNMNLDTLQGNLDISMMRAGLYTSYPIIKKQLGIYIFGQELLYNTATNLLLKTRQLFVDESESDQIQEYLDYIQLPNFRDLGMGVRYQINSNWNLDYNLLFASDLFHVIESSDFEQIDNILGEEDTLAYVEVHNQVHNINSEYWINSDLAFTQTFAFQSNDWKVDFNSDEFAKFKLDEKSFHSKSYFTLDQYKHHQIQMGWSYDYISQKYDMNIARPLYQFIHDARVELSSMFSLFSPDGYVFDSNFLKQSESILNNIIHTEVGYRQQWLNGLFIEDKWDIDNNSELISGLRLEHETMGNSVFIAPRFSYKNQIDKKNTLSLGAGLYSQNQYPFNYRHFNKDLVSEKSLHLNTEWTHQISSKLKFEIANYYKFNYDLVSSTLKNNGVDWDGLSEGFEKYVRDSDLLPVELDSIFYENKIYYSGDSLQKYWNRLELDNQDFLEEQFSFYRLHYENGGKGHSLGTEWTLHYKPNDSWSGRLSAETGLALRKDRGSDTWYNFDNHRIWSARWKNKFDFDGGYSLSVKYSASSGKPYTDLVFDDEDNIRAIGKRNHRRYTMYSRTDLRVSHTGLLWGYPLETYTELWNVFFNPNAFLVDSETGKLRGIETSMPVPILFFGLRYQF